MKALNINDKDISQKEIMGIPKQEKTEHVQERMMSVIKNLAEENLNKTILTKLKVYSALLKTLTNDQYNILTSKLANLIKEPRMHYIYPETTCPECGKTFEEENIESMLQLLFTRAQLATIKSL